MQILMELIGVLVFSGAVAAGVYFATTRIRFVKPEESKPATKPDDVH